MTLDMAFVAWKERLLRQWSGWVHMWGLRFVIVHKLDMSLKCHWGLEKHVIISQMCNILCWYSVPVLIINVDLTLEKVKSLYWNEYLHTRNTSMHIPLLEISLSSLSEMQFVNYLFTPYTYCPVLSWVG